MAKLHSFYGWVVFHCVCVCVCMCLLQSCPTLCYPIDYSPTGSSVHGDSSGKNTRVGGCHFLLQGIFLTQGWNLHLLCLLHWQVEKAMAPHSSTLAWKIPWTEEPGGLQSMGSLWVGHDWATSLSLFTFTNWRRKWQPTPVFLPGESQGRGSLVGCHLWGHTESDTTEAT